MHEASHMSSTERIKYLIMLECMDVCDFCEHSYYVYGCERDCTHNNCNRNNNYSDFVPVNPLHNKKISGGVWDILIYIGWFIIVAEISTANIVLDMQWKQLLRKEELNNEK